MLSDIYYREKLGVPFVTIIIFITCCIITVPTYFDNNLYYVFANRNGPIYWWQTFSGSFEHSIFNNPPLIIHFMGNMIFLCILGGLCERVVGSFKFLILVVSGMIILPLHLCLTSSGGGISTNAGASGIAYIFPPMVIYMIDVLWNKNRTQLKQEKMLYLILFLVAFMYIFISIFSSMSTNSVHCIATIVGSIYLFIWHKDIKNRIVDIIDKDKVEKNKIKSLDKIAMIFSLVFLVLMTTILIMNYITGYKKLFFKVTDSKTEYTIEEINTNQNRIVINFNEPLNGSVNMRSHLYSEKQLVVDAEVSSDGLSCEIVFNRALRQGEDYGSFILDRNISKNGKVLESREINFK